jgi:hypothetical protein
MICEFFSCFSRFQDNDEAQAAPNNALLNDIQDIISGINVSHTTEPAIESIMQLLPPFIDNLDLTAIHASKQEMQQIKAFFDANIQGMYNLQMSQVQEAIRRFQDEFNNLILEANAAQLATDFYPIIDLQQRARKEDNEKKNFNIFIRQWIEKFFSRLELHFGYPLNVNSLIEQLLEKTQHSLRELQKEGFQAAPVIINTTQPLQDELCSLLEDAIDELSPEELMRECIVSIQMQNQLKAQREGHSNLALIMQRI